MGAPRCPHQLARSRTAPTTTSTRRRAARRAAGGATLVPRAIGIVRAGRRPASGAPTRHAAHAARVLRRRARIRWMMSLAQ